MILVEPDARPVVAHRGDSAHHPENTFVSFDRAVALGADALEFDLRLTADGVAVVLHDPTLDRTTSGRGEVASLTLAQVRAADAGARFGAEGDRPFAGRGLVVPTFEEMLERYTEIPLLIEVKVPEVVAEARRLIHRHGAAGRVLLDSTVDAAVVPFRGEFRTGASLRDNLALLPWAFLPGGPATLPYEALCITPRYYGIPVPIRRMARRARRAGAVTHVWTVNDAGEAERFWGEGVQGIITDDPALMLKVRARV